MITTARNANLDDLATILKDQNGRKLDVVAPASNISSSGGVFVVRLPEPVLTEHGVTDMVSFTPTAVFDEGLADKLRIPLSYLRRLRAERPDLYDGTVNGWLRGSKPRRTVADGVTQEHGPDPRSFMLRTFLGDTYDGGVGRAFLSDKYARIDHLDTLTAALAGVEAAGVAIDVHSADLTDRRMVVRISAPEVAATAPRLLDGYRSPFTGAQGSDNPTVFAGFELANSETGEGAWTITPRLVVEVCANGMKITRDAMRSVHTGSRLDDGVIAWSEETQQKQLALITSKTADAVRTFLNVEYLQRTVVALEEKAGQPVDSPESVTRILGPASKGGLGFTEAEVDAILGQFVRGGQMTRGGIVNAITAHAQTVDDGDDAYRLETKATSLLGV